MLTGVLRWLLWGGQILEVRLGARDGPEGLRWFRWPILRLDQVQAEKWGGVGRAGADFKLIKPWCWQAEHLE